jgi:hypothetical protein
MALPMRPLVLLCLAAPAAAAIAFFAANARANSTVCRDGTLIETGERVDAVLARCGNPSWRRVSVIHSRRYPSITTELQEWIYDLGEGSFLRYLRFTNGTLDAIEERSREAL